MIRKYFLAVLLICSASIIPSAKADSGLDIAVGKGLHLKQIDGSWVQLEHFIPKTRQTDVCVASSRDQALVLRIARADMQIRTYDPKWDLSLKDKNSIQIRLGNGYEAKYDLRDLDKKGFVADVSFAQMSALLKALETEKPGTLTFSNLKLRHAKRVKKVNPAKAERVFAAFRNCVRENRFAPLEAPQPILKKSKKAEEKVVFPDQNAE